ncbi:MAG: hypothetical protein QOD63_2584 [Actinomycetota bacterium]|nr:hypothetical protein [Actinomycetota bacterium]
MTKHFYDRGWRGVNVEPSLLGYRRFLSARPRDVNLNVALSSAPASVTFYEAPEQARGVSTLSDQRAGEYRVAGRELTETTVQVTTLAGVCAEHVTGDIDFISIDVEGHERQVIEGGDWARWRPRVVVVEAVTPQEFVPCHDDWEPLLLDSGYLFGLFDGLNRFYVRQEEPELLERLHLQANATDNFISQFHMYRYTTMIGGVDALGSEDLRALQAMALRFPRSTSLVSRVVRQAAKRLSK